jgi:hypothetical protein
MTYNSNLEIIGTDSQVDLIKISLIRKRIEYPHYTQDTINRRIVFNETKTRPITQFEYIFDCETSLLVRIIVVIAYQSVLVVFIGLIRINLVHGVSFRERHIYSYVIAQ